MGASLVALAMHVCCLSDSSLAVSRRKGTFTCRISEEATASSASMVVTPMVLKQLLSIHVDLTLNPLPAT